MDRTEGTILVASILYLTIFILVGYFYILPIVTDITLDTFLSLPLLEIIAVILYFTVGLYFFVSSILLIVGMIAIGG